MSPFVVFESRVFNHLRRDGYFGEIARAECVQGMRILQKFIRANFSARGLFAQSHSLAFF